MLLWVFFALMTAGTLAAILRPLARPAPGETPVAADAGGTLAVYRDQLSEIETEVKRGVLEASEAEAARIEISRRLLAAAQADPGTASARSPGLPEQPEAMATAASARSQRFALAIAAFTPLFALSLYLVYGSPGMPGQPHAQRMQDVLRREKLHDAQVTDLVARVEARLREAPEDGRGWEVIAPIYFKLGRFREAADAFAKANRLLGENIGLLAGYADATVYAADGIVNEDARRAYARVLALDPARVEARFWLALAKEQDGDLKGARADYDSLAASAPADAPWREAVEQRARAVAQRLDGTRGDGPRMDGPRVDGPRVDSKGPSPEDIAAAQALDPASRQKMIEGMVDGLAQRLKTDGRDLAGWVRLVRAYTVLKRTDEARAAVIDARKALAHDAGALDTLSQLASSLGLGS